MKKALVILSYPIITLLVLGTLLKIMHISFAGFVLLISITSLIILVLLFLFSKLKEEKTILARLTYLSIMATTSTSLLGILAKLMYWPSADTLLKFGAIGLIFPSLLLYLIYHLTGTEKNNNEFYKGSFAIILTCFWTILFINKPNFKLVENYTKLDFIQNNINENLRSTNYNLYQLLQTNSSNSCELKCVGIIHTATESLYEAIDSTKLLIIRTAGGNIDSTFYLTKNYRHDDLDAVSRILILSKEGKTLQYKIATYIDPINIEIKKCNIAIDTSLFASLPLNSKPNSAIDWADYFDGSPVSAALFTLSTFQSSILNFENKSLNLITKSTKHF